MHALLEISFACHSVSLNCTSSDFDCGHSVCINATFQCDGRRECLDGSDELDCGKPTYIILFLLLKIRRKTLLPHPGKDSNPITRLEPLLSIRTLIRSIFYFCNSLDPEYSYCISVIFCEGWRFLISRCCATMQPQPVFDSVIYFSWRKPEYSHAVLSTDLSL